MTGQEIELIMILASSFGGALDLSLGEEVESPAAQVMEKYPYVFIR